MIETNFEYFRSLFVIGSHDKNLLKMSEGLINIVLVIVTQASDQKGICVVIVRSQDITKSRINKLLLFDI